MYFDLELGVVCFCELLVLLQGFPYCFDSGLVLNAGFGLGSSCARISGFFMGGIFVN